MQEVLAEKKVLEELGVGCQWPIGSIARMNDKEFNIYSILLTKEGEILKEQTEKGSIKNALELGERIGRLFADYV
jgi:hydroxymethylbilane synthase